MPAAEEEEMVQVKERKKRNLQREGGD